MNCDDFTAWLNERLDSRSDLRLTASAQRHIDTCETCAGELNAWQQISSVLPNDIDRPGVVRPARRQNIPAAVSLLVASAACLLAVVLSVNAWINQNDPAVVAEASPSPGTDSLANATLPNIGSSPQDNRDQSLNTSFVVVDAGNWWQRVDRQEWIDSAMPTVQSMRDGVAPLGRSFVQAVSLLTRFGGARAS